MRKIFAHYELGIWRGYIPTVNHTVPPDVSYENFMYYMEIKQKAFKGEYVA